MIPSTYNIYVHAHLTFISLPCANLRSVSECARTQRPTDNSYAKRTDDVYNIYNSFDCSMRDTTQKKWQQQPHQHRCSHASLECDSGCLRSVLTYFWSVFTVTYFRSWYTALFHVCRRYSGFTSACLHFSCSVAAKQLLSFSFRFFCVHLCLLLAFLAC